MEINILPREGKFFKANLHAHTVNSDGMLTPEQMKTLYMDNGYSIIAFTDHNVLNYFNELDEEKFLTLCGYEFDVCDNNSYAGFTKCCHICAIARNANDAMQHQCVIKPETYSITAINAVTSKLANEGYILNYNHPAWSAEEAVDFLPLENITAMEIYNHGCEICSSDGDNRAHYDVAVKHGRPWKCIATDDNHNWELQEDKAGYESDSLGGYTVFRAESLTYDNIISALEKGDFYSCMGVGAPEIYDCYIEDMILKIDCSPVKGIVLKSDCLGASDYKTSQFDDIIHAEFNLAELTWGGKFFRLELVDSQHRMAFTNPVYIKKDDE